MGWSGGMSSSVRRDWLVVCASAVLIWFAIVERVDGRVGGPSRDLVHSRHLRGYTRGVLNNIHRSNVKGSQSGYGYGTGGSAVYGPRFIHGFRPDFMGARRRRADFLEEVIEDDVPDWVLYSIDDLDDPDLDGEEVTVEELLPPDFNHVDAAGEGLIVENDYVFETDIVQPVHDLHEDASQPLVEAIELDHREHGLAPPRAHSPPHVGRRKVPVFDENGFSIDPYHPADHEDVEPIILVDPIQDSHPPSPIDPLVDNPPPHIHQVHHIEDYPPTHSVDPLEDHPHQPQIHFVDPLVFHPAIPPIDPVQNDDPPNIHLIDPIADYHLPARPVDPRVDPFAEMDSDVLVVLDTPEVMPPPPHVSSQPPPHPPPSGSGHHDPRFQVNLPLELMYNKPRGDYEGYDEYLVPVVTGMTTEDGDENTAEPFDKVHMLEHAQGWVDLDGAHKPNVVSHNGLHKSNAGRDKVHASGHIFPSEVIYIRPEDGGGVQHHDGYDVPHLPPVHHEEDGYDLRHHDQWQDNTDGDDMHGEDLPETNTLMDGFHDWLAAQSDPFFDQDRGSSGIYDDIYVFKPQNEVKPQIEREAFNRDDFEDWFRRKYGRQVVDDRKNGDDTHDRPRGVDRWSDRQEEARRWNDRKHEFEERMREDTGRRRKTNKRGGNRRNHKTGFNQYY